MSVRKLFYEDSHMSRFSARVLFCTPAEEGYAVTLDQTAFYPEGGGQAGDTGTLGTARVLDTRPQGEDVLHLCDSPLTPGDIVEGEIDYALRFRRMQQHSGEHIVSGLLHRRYGCHNTGFHMGGDGIITVDFDVPIPEAALPEVEAEANAAVWKDLEIKCWIPSPEELPAIPYRSKRALAWPVRIVEIPGYDICACCGTHVERTGEIGLVKLLSAIPFRGGTRMEMACGQAALEILNRAYGQNLQVSRAFSAPAEETGAAARRMNEQLEQERFRAVGLRRQIFGYIAREAAGKPWAVRFEDGLAASQVRELADTVGRECPLVAVLSGSEAAGWSYCLLSAGADLRPLGKALAARFAARGGGRPTAQQGKLTGPRQEIQSFLEQSLTALAQG